MTRFAALYLLTFIALTSSASTNKLPPASDPRAVIYALQSVIALTGNTSITNVTLSGNVTRTAGSETDSGTGTFKAFGTNQSRMDLSLSNGAHTEIRDASTGSPMGEWAAPNGKLGQLPFHNCMTDAAWFFPALSSLSQTGNPKFIFSYLGQEEHDGSSSQHIRVYQVPLAGLTHSPLPQLSRMDFYLDPASFLPLAVTFNTHADRDMNINIPVEVRFGDYQSVNGSKVPFHVQRLLNGTVVLDITFTNVVFNTGISQNLFSLQ